MQLAPTSSPRTSQKGLRPALHVQGDEPLLAQEAGERSAPPRARPATPNARSTRRRRALRLERAARRLAGDEPVRRRAADRAADPVGQAGQGGSEALQRYCESADDDVVTLVHLPQARPPADEERLVRRARRSGHRDAVDRRAQGAAAVDRAAPGRAGPACQRGEAGQRTLAFFADRVEGNLLAAHQEIQKLGLLYPEGKLGFEQSRPRCSTSRATTSSSSARRCSPARSARALRMLDGLQAEGEAAGAGALDARRRHPCAQARQGRMADGKPLPWRCARRASGASRSACSSALCRCWASTSSRTCCRRRRSAMASSKA